MKVLFDTSVLTAAFLRKHEFHAAAAAWLVAAKSTAVEMFVSAHSLAELYSTLTRMPKPLAIPPVQVWRMIEADILPQAKVRTLPASRYVRMIRRLADSGVVGGIVYDTVIAEVARLGKVEYLLTLDVPHFERVVESQQIQLQVISPLTTRPPTSD